MKRITIAVFLVFICFVSYSQNWQPAGDKIKTPWAEKIDVNNVLPEYPRPQMVRSDWKNLNGLWDYAIQPTNGYFPEKYDGKILVPFAIESSLSGVMKTVGKDNDLWYHSSFAIPADWRGKNVLLHFGAVDWKTEVWVNDIKVGGHQGGDTPFFFDITPFLNPKGEQKLVVKVWDPTEYGNQPRGKQMEVPSSRIRYSAVTGIWQTVWLEPVNKKYISGLKIVPNIDTETVSILAETKGATSTDVVAVKVLDKGKVICEGKAVNGQKVLLQVKDAKLWSPESPFLYDLEISLLSENKEVDKIDSYFGMRKISTKKDENGVVRIQLNNKNVFQFGPLDQGWWPDGLYTAPTDEALKFDIVQTKELGYNLIRKHVKVEPARWYYHCDKEGIMVWQDMPNSGSYPQEWQTRSYYSGPELVKSATDEKIYRDELKELMDFCYSNPCVVVWVTFNERWGQFKTKEIVEWTKDYDPSRLVNPASGGNHYPVGDILDMHHYPQPVMGLYDPERANALGEYGGIGYTVKEHVWDDTEGNFSYVEAEKKEELTQRYIDYAEMLKKLIPYGYSAAVYTQTTDVEKELNGLITYDRKVIKLDKEKIRKINEEICNSLK